MMKKAILSIAGMALLVVQVGCASKIEKKYSKQELGIQKQEAKEMIDNSKTIKIKRGLGSDKIILND